MIEIEGFFDCSCVWAYLALEQVGRFSNRTGVQVQWRPVLAQEVFDTVNPAVNWPLSDVKQDYYRRDLAEWSAFLCLPLAADPPGPADTTSCMQACIAAGRWDRLEDFARIALDAAWAKGRDLSDRTVLAELWAEAGLPAPVFDEGLAWPEIAAELRANTRELMARGGFGVPTFFLGDGMYFGNDAIPLLERSVSEQLKLAGIAP